ncbi:Uncharacterized protein TCM_045213 [Theobroma cacao]|uniref:Uncharacterized protein n=1 Tax=Theobroma cacao TaxID=3641 RepID=A0A061FRY3_THECC|nr:Uncharacterized protein TCM_045213 [Theobroma cacao]
MFMDMGHLTTLAVLVGYLDKDLITVAHRGDTKPDAKPCGVSIDIRGNECHRDIATVVTGPMGVPIRDRTCLA